MPEVKGYTGECDICTFVALERSVAAVEYMLRLHKSAVHGKWQHEE